ncbi:hypothetical protein L7F22_066481 [Adiantum nelumboides]|nr:hypothetical protein [Adiantum nelumboides]
MGSLAAAAGSCRVFLVEGRGRSFLGSVRHRASLSCGFRLSSRKLYVARAPLASNQEVLDAAWEILDEFNKNDVKGLQQPSLASPDGVFALGASVVAVVEASRMQEGCLPLLGICANNCKEALTVMQQWTTALGCEFCRPQVMETKHDLNSVPGPVYIKYNAHAKTSYLQSYTGRFRGVIVQIGQKQVGHLPLSLFS